MATVLEEKKLSVQLIMTPELAGELSRETGALEVAKAYEITDPAMAIAANDELRSVKTRIVRIKEVRASFIAPAKQIIATAEAFFNPAIQALEAAEKFLKDGLLGWSEKQARIVDDARRAQEAEERKARQEADAKAAAERARAEEEARQKQRVATEAEAARLKAIAEGNDRAAKAAAAAKAKAEEEGRAALETGNRKATEIELLAAAASSSAPAIAEPAKLDGFSQRDNWIADFKDGHDEEAVKYDICCAIAEGRRELLSLIKFDMPAAHRLAKAQKRNMNVPGLAAVNRPIAASRG